MRSIANVWSSAQIMIWLYWLMNAIAPVLAGIAVIYIVSKIWGWWFSKHDGRRDGK